MGQFGIGASHFNNRFQSYNPGGPYFQGAQFRSNPGGPYFEGRLKADKQTRDAAIDDFANGSVASGLAGSSFSAPHTPLTALSGLGLLISGFYNGVDGLKKILGNNTSAVSKQDQEIKKGDLV